MAAKEHQHHGDYQHDPGDMYNEKWVQDILKQLKEFVSSNHYWLGLDPGKGQRVLDYACGNGPISESLAQVCPKAMFQGIDILPSQVDRFNETSSKLFGDDTSRMSAVVGDLYNTSASLKETEWYDFDVAITSMALHHFADPVEMLRRLAERVKSGGTVVVMDWLNEIPIARNATEGGEGRKKVPFHPAHHANQQDMMETGHGVKVWAGFTLESIKECMAAAGLRNTEVLLHPELSKMPEGLGGDKQIFYAKAYVP